MYVLHLNMNMSLELYSDFLSNVPTSSKTSIRCTRRYVRRDALVINKQNSYESEAGLVSSLVLLLLSSEKFVSLAARFFVKRYSSEQRIVKKNLITSLLQATYSKD